jgi:hypothetical protein
VFYQIRLFDISSRKDDKVIDYLWLIQQIYFILSQRIMRLEPDVVWVFTDEFFAALCYHK